MNKTLLIILITTIVIVLVFLLIFFLTYKNLTKLRKQIDESFEALDNNFKERWILIPNLISILKRYIKQDSTLENIIKLRNNLYNKKSKEEKIEINKKLESSLPTILNIIKSYPDLKTNKNFIDLLDKLNDIERNIESSKNQYDEKIHTYNNKLENFPSNLIAKLFKLSSISLFDANKKSN